jgi:hypothetical protein
VAQRLSDIKALHVAYMDTPSMPIATPDGDISADPTGFNCARLLQHWGKELLTFYDQAWQR